MKQDKTDMRQCLKFLRVLGYAFNFHVSVKENLVKMKRGKFCEFFMLFPEKF